MGGRASLLHLYSRPRSQSRLAQTKKTPLQLPLPHPWDFLAETPSLRSSNPLRPYWLPLQSQTRFLRLPPPPSLIPHPSASPLCPTSLSQIPPMMSLPSTPRSQILLTKNFLSTPRPQPHIKPSTSTTGTSKYCAGTRSSVSTSAHCPSTPPHFVGCLPRPT